MSSGRWRDRFCHAPREATPPCAAGAVPVSWFAAAAADVAFTMYNCERCSHLHASLAHLPSPTGRRLTSHAASRSDQSLFLRPGFMPSSSAQCHNVTCLFAESRVKYLVATRENTHARSHTHTALHVQYARGRVGIHEHDTVRVRCDMVCSTRPQVLDVEIVSFRASSVHLTPQQASATRHTHTPTHSAAAASPYRP